LGFVPQPNLSLVLSDYALIIYIEVYGVKCDEKIYYFVDFTNEVL
jgi:hypothetical protein